jgi:hypothetical protein
MKIKTFFFLIISFLFLFLIFYAEIIGDLWKSGKIYERILMLSSISEKYETMKFYSERISKFIDLIIIKNIILI